MWRYRQPGVAFQLLNELQRQQQCNILCDTLLQTEGMSVPVHSCILAAFSPFLYRELSTSPSYPMGPRRLIRVPAIGAQALLKLISYLYSGEMKGLGPTEHNDVKAAFIRLGMSHLIHKFEEDGRQWRDTDRGLLLELEGGTLAGTENGSTSVQTPGGKSVDNKATQTEAESNVHAATQTSSRDACAVLNQWLPLSSDGHDSGTSTSTQSVEVSPTAGVSSFVILTPVSDPSANSDNVTSCQVSLLSYPTVHCDPLLPRSPVANTSDTLNPSFENLSDDFFAATTQPHGSVVSTLQVDKERANTLTDAFTVSGPGPGEQATKDGASERSASKVRRSERLMTMKEKEVLVKNKAHTLDKPVKGLKMKFKRKCKNAVWEIERPVEDPAMMAKLPVSSAAAVQKDLVDSEERLNGSPTLLIPHNPTSAHCPTQAASNQAGPFVQNKAPLSPAHVTPEECDEQMDKFLDYIMMDLNFLLPIPTERGDGRLQQRPLSYFPSDPSGQDSAPWLGEAEVSIVNTQMGKGVGSDLMVVSQLGTSFAEGVGSVNGHSSGRLSEVRSARSHTSTASPGLPKSGGNVGMFSPAELGLAHQGWSPLEKLPSPEPISKEPKANGSRTCSCIPDLEEMRLRSCLSPLQPDNENALGCQQIPNRPTGQSTSFGVNISPLLSLTPVDLQYPLNSVLLKSPYVTEEPAVKRIRRQKSLFVQHSTVPGSENASGSSTSRQMASSKEGENLGVSPVVRRNLSIEEERAREREKSLRKGVRRLLVKRKYPVGEKCEMTSVGMSSGVGLRSTDSNVRHSSISAGKSKRRISTTALPKLKEDLPEITRQKQGRGHAKSTVGCKSSYSAGVPKRKRGRPPKYTTRSAVLSPTVKTAARESRTVSISRRLISETHGHKQWTQISSKQRQGQEDNRDNLTSGNSQDEALNQNKSEHQSPTLSSGAVTKFQSAEENSVQKDVLATSSQLKPASVTEVKTNTSTPMPSQTLKRFRELLERKGYLMKRKRSATDEGGVQNHQCLEKDPSTPCKIITLAGTDKTPEQTEVKCPLTRPITYHANKADTNNQLAPLQSSSPKPGTKASRARKWAEGSTGSCDEEEKEPEDEDLEEDVDVLSGSPVSLPMFECGLVGGEPSDVEEIDEDVDIITVDID